MAEVILVLNAGSSSIKFAVYQTNDLVRLAHGQITGLNADRRVFEHAVGGDKKRTQNLEEVTNHQQAIVHILSRLQQVDQSWRVVAVGHRVVHGGPSRNHAALITAEVLRELAQFKLLAPQHQHHNLAGIESVARVMPDLPQVACFDTAFHASQPAVHRILPLPQQLRDQGLMRYGFHGLSYEYLVSEVPKHYDRVLPDNLIIAHLGNGASVCAVKQGKSLATTMGFSTLDGLIMGSRSGSIDPGVLLHLLTAGGLSIDELSTCLYEQSGLLGLSGLSSDMRELEASDTTASALALETYVMALVKHIMALVAVMEGFDAIVFSGGVGENSAFIRHQVLTRLRWLGCDIDIAANQAGESRITTNNSKIVAFVIPTNEELVIAKQTRALWRD